MPNAKKLVVEEDPRFQQREWLVQRIGWIAWGLIVMAALVGLVGSGPLSSTEAAAPDGSLRVAYDQFLHYHNPTRLKLRVQSKESGSEPFRIQVDLSLLDRIEVTRIEPEPEGREFSPDGVIYSFPRQPEAEQATIVLHVQYHCCGGGEGRIAVLGSQPAILNQFVYP